MDISSVLWIVAAVVAFVIEGLTVQLVTVWFGLGALLAGIAAYFGMGISVQFGIFIVVSVVCLLALRPMTKKYLRVKPTATNADQVLGEEVLVTESFESETNRGRLKVNGLEWTAECKGTIPVEKGMRVKVLSIQGVTLNVEIVGVSDAAKE